jgi:hypothetical protein
LAQGATQLLGAFYAFKLCRGRCTLSVLFLFRSFFVLCIFSFSFLFLSLGRLILRLSVPNTYIFFFFFAVEELRSIDDPMDPFTRKDPLSPPGLSLFRCCLV